MRRFSRDIVAGTVPDLSVRCSGDSAGVSLYPGTKTGGRGAGVQRRTGSSKHPGIKKLDTKPVLLVYATLFVSLIMVYLISSRIAPLLTQTADVSTTVCGLILGMAGLFSAVSSIRSGGSPGGSTRCRCFS